MHILICFLSLTLWLFDLNSLRCQLTRPASLCSPTVICIRLSLACRLLLWYVPPRCMYTNVRRACTFQSKCNRNTSGEQEWGKVKEDWVGYYRVRSEFPAEGRRLRWHKWGKRGSHSCSLISVMETHPFCQGLQKISGETAPLLAARHHLAGRPQEGESEQQGKDKAPALSTGFSMSLWEFQTPLKCRLGSGKPLPETVPLSAASLCGLGGRKEGAGVWSTLSNMKWKLGRHYTPNPLTFMGLYLFGESKKARWQSAECSAILKMSAELQRLGSRG